jgi:pyruvate dehydrogenase E2 component (dihydrolipoamide acetyltransferase)
MQHKILMPKLGLTMAEGVISECMVAVGAPFKADEGLFVVETDKVATEVPAEGSGVLTEIIFAAGETVPVGEVVAYWSDAKGEVASAAKVLQKQEKPVACAPTPAAKASVEPASASVITLSSSERVLATPLARRLAEQRGVNLREISGTGPRGAVKARDVQAFEPADKAVSATAAPAATPARTEGLDPGTRSRPGSVQAAMARRLTAAKQDVPHFYLSVEVDVGRLLAVRAEVNTITDPFRLTLNHFIVAAVGRALRDMPQANRVWADGEILSYTSADVGVAVNTERGLFVPVVRDVGRLSLVDGARQTQEKTEAARNGTLKPDDMAGGAITVSNAGMFNVKFMTPIINPGQAMILGVGSISDVFRPDTEGKPVLKKEMGLVLAADHRLLDGVSGLTFLRHVTGYLEQPLKLLIGAAP